MGKIEVNSGNDTLTGDPGHKEVWVGMEVTPSGLQWHVASGSGDSPTLAVFAVLQASADDPNTTLADWWAEASIKLPDWTGRVLTAGTARGLLAPAVRQAARKAFKS
jgi:hypothetical protein